MGLYDREIRAILDTIPADKAEFSPNDMREAERILKACCAVLDPSNVHPGQVKDMLSGLNNGYGDWLRTISEAIIDADIDE